jgi:DnaJ family protein A protein 2
LTPGFPEGREMIFENKGNEHPDNYPGDLHIRINMKKHHKFKRDGADLFMDLDITLKEALLGFKKSVQFLDGSPLKITSEPGQFISNGDTKTIKGKGMPFFKRENSFGDLHVKFKVKFPEPEEFTEEIREELNKVSPHNPIS